MDNYNVSQDHVIQMDTIGFASLLLMYSRIQANL